MPSSYGQAGDRRAYTSDANYSADGTGQYRAVKRTATGIVLCGVADVDFLGILQDDPATGQSGTVKTMGGSKAVVGANVAITDELTTDAAGRLVPATTGQVIVARPLEATTLGSGTIIAVEIRVGGTK